MPTPATRGPSRLRWWLAALLLLVTGWTLPARADLDTCRPLPAALWPKDNPLTIEWKESWEATAQANLARWQKEIPAQEADGPRRLAYRRVRLLMSLAEKFPQPVERRLKAYEELAGLLEGLGYRAGANYFRKRVVTEAPGNVALAVRQLVAILDKFPWQYPDLIEDGPEWVRYASDRIVALHRGGEAQATAGALDPALRGQYQCCFWQRDLVGAADVLRAAAARPGLENWVAGRWAELLQQAGRGDDSLTHREQASDDAWPPEARNTDSHPLGHLLGALPMFPRALSLEMRWEGLRNNPASERADALVGLLKEAGPNTGWTYAGGFVHVAMWRAIDRDLLSRPRGALAELRKASQAEAADAFDAATLADAERTLLAFRRYPWATAAHEALLHVGLRALREGRCGWAAGSFRDVLAHADDPAVIEQARVGLILALAQEGSNQAEVQRLLGEVPAGGTVPWPGRRVGAAELARQLSGAPRGGPSAPAGEPALSTLRRQLLELDCMPWRTEAMRYGDGEGGWERMARLGISFGQLQTCGESILVSGPSLLACYDSNSARPRWVRADRLHAGASQAEEAGRLAPGSFQPAVSGGRVYTRWGLQPARLAPSAVAAFELGSGRMLWSTSGDPAWEHLAPVSDPACAEGRVYVLALTGGGMTTLRLACLDAGTGQTLWICTLATQNLDLRCGLGNESRTIDLAHYGTPLTVRQGQVVGVSNLGFVFKCDARDGMPIWARAYDRAFIQAYNLDTYVRRLGAAPLVVGGKIIFLARDRPGVFALDDATGQPAWDCPLAPSEELVGLAGGMLVVRDSMQVAGVDAAGGTIRWHYRPAEGVTAHPQLVGQHVYLAAGRRLLRLDAQTGQVVEEAAWPEAEPVRALAVAGDSLAVVTQRSAAPRAPAIAVPAAATQPAGSPPAVALPMRRIWELRRPEPRLIVPQPTAIGSHTLLHAPMQPIEPPPSVAGAIFLISQGVLERVDPAAGGTGSPNAVHGVWGPLPTWQRLVGQGLEATEWTEDSLLLVYERHVIALDPATGRERWRFAPPLGFSRCRVWGRYVVLWRRRPGAAVLDAASGRLLWQNSFLPELDNCGLEDVGWDGTNLHFLCSGPRYGQQPTALLDVVCAPEPQGGDMILARRTLADDARLIQAVQGRAVYVGPENRLWTVPLTPAGKPVRFLPDVPAEIHHALNDVRASGPWLKFQVLNAFRAWVPSTWIVNVDDPSYVLPHGNDISLRGQEGWLSENGLFRRVDLKTKTTTNYAADSAPDYESRQPLEFWTQANTVCCVWQNRRGRNPGDGRPDALQLELYERATGRRIGGQALAGVAPWQGAAWRQTPLNQVVLRGGVLVVTDADGLHAFAAGQEPPEPPAAIAYRRGTATQPMAATALNALTPGARGTLQVSHDGQNLCLEVRHAASAASPWCGSDEWGGGSRLEVAVACDQGVYRFSCGQTERGEFAADGFAGGRAPEGVAGAVRHDLATGEVVYQVAIPLRALRNGLVAGVRLGVAVWSEDITDGATAKSCRRVLESASTLRGRSFDARQLPTIRLQPPGNAPEPPKR